MSNESLPTTRREAKELGVPYYFDGKPCINGHIDKRRTHNYTCNTCEKEIRKKSAKTSDSHYISKKHAKTMRRLVHPNQMPAWADKKKIGGRLIEARNKGLVLDHMIPLRGKVSNGSKVCGLHCEDNLIAIDYIENNKKSYNKWPDMWDKF